jgi:hypothetical protein
VILLVDIEGTVLVLLLTLIVGFSTFFGFVGTSSSANDTNVTNITNTSNVTRASSAVTALADPTPNVSGSSSTVSISVTSPINLKNVIADGSTYNYTSVTQVNASATEAGWFLYTLNDNLNLYVKASGDLASDSDIIPLNNLKYDGFSNSGLFQTSFSTDYAEINSWGFTYVSGLLYTHWSTSANVNGNYYLTVPTGVSSGTYNTTVYYVAMIQ